MNSPPEAAFKPISNGIQVVLHLQDRTAATRVALLGLRQLRLALRCSERTVSERNSHGFRWSRAEIDRNNVSKATEEKKKDVYFFVLLKRKA